jgi:hypothetical protein
MDFGLIKNDKVDLSVQVSGFRITNLGIEGILSI